MIAKSIQPTHGRGSIVDTSVSSPGSLHLTHSSARLPPSVYPIRVVTLLTTPTPLPEPPEPPDPLFAESLVNLRLSFFIHQGHSSHSASGQPESEGHGMHAVVVPGRKVKITCPVARGACSRLGVLVRCHIGPSEPHRCPIRAQ